MHGATKVVAVSQSLTSTEQPTQPTIVSNEANNLLITASCIRIEDELEKETYTDAELIAAEALNPQLKACFVAL